MSALLIFIFVTLPWLNPFSPGPTPAVGPFLFAWICAALLWATLVVNNMKGLADTSIRAVALAWLTAAALSALIGLLQYFGATAWAGQWMNHTGFGEAYGNLRQRNQFATLINIGLAALLWWSVNARKASTPCCAPLSLEWLVVQVPLVIAFLIGLGNGVSSSRTGLIQLGLLGMLTWVWQRRTAVANKHPRHLPPTYQIILAVFLGYVVATALLPALAGLDPLASGAWARLRPGDALCSSRITLWRNVLHLIAQKPWMGWGWGELDYAHFITLYPGARFCDILDNAHNLPLHLAVELGLPAAILTCGMAAWLVWRAKPWLETNTTRQLAWGVLAVIGLHSLLEYPLWYGPFQTAAILSVWMLWRSSQHQATRTAEATCKTRTVYVQLGAALVLLALCGITAWNYQLVSQIYLPPQARLADYRDNTMEKLSKLPFFQDQVRFADLTTTELDAQNAQKVHDLALDMLHFSPESRVIELVLESAKLLGRDKEVDFYAARYQAAFPQAYARWAATQPTQ